MSHPDQPAEQPRARGSAPLPPPAPMVERPSSPPPPPPSSPPPPPPTVVDWSPPDPSPPTVPTQPAGAHDAPAAPPHRTFAAGSASLPTPAPPPVPELASAPPGPTAPPWAPPGPVPQPGPAPYPPARAGGGGGRKAAVVILSVLAGLLLVGGGLMTYLWLDTAGELDDTRTDLTSQINELSGTVEARDGEIDRLGIELRETEDALTDAQTQLEGTGNRVEQLEEDQDTIRECIFLLGEANAALEDENEARADSLLEAAEPICDEADRILGF